MSNATIRSGVKYQAVSQIETTLEGSSNSFESTVEFIYQCDLHFSENIRAECYEMETHSK